MSLAIIGFVIFNSQTKPVTEFAPFSSVPPEEPIPPEDERVIQRIEEIKRELNNELTLLKVRVDTIATRQEGVGDIGTRVSRLETRLRSFEYEVQRMERDFDRRIRRLEMEIRVEE